ncbi:MAG TPA: carbon monoxide dehydrogenase [Elusimicrobia bacterium]|nr:MAG: hypothetical protein A2551_02680 [Elusimicrobia bacterium RIFOXYD2_FULL_34_30]HAM38477.1 carbon monoxide dehydrogenase [Elusimicrobiota bacterium]
MNKIAITGKGGVGKTTIAAVLSILFSKEKKVIAVDADPDSNLAASIGFPESEKIIPISEMKDLINKRTEYKNGFFKMNPKVEDIPEKFCPEYKNIRLINMGVMKKGGSGCFCPENAFIKTLVGHLIIQRDEVLIMDMPAGIENLSRGTASGVDAVSIVVEPDIKSIETASRIEKLCKDLKIKKVFAIGNKVTNKNDENYIVDNIKGIEILGFICYDSNFRNFRGAISDDNISLINQIDKIKSKLGGLR